MTSIEWSLKIRAVLAVLAWPFAAARHVGGLALAGAYAAGREEAVRSLRSELATCREVTIPTLQNQVHVQEKMNATLSMALARERARVQADIAALALKTAQSQGAHPHD